MKEKDILKLRLHTQGLSVKKHGSVKDVVASLGAVQAQDYAMAKWAIGLRLAGASDAMVENAINNGDIIRVHIMRPTWHFVTPEDIRWMTMLTAPNIKKLAASQNKQIGLTATTITKCLKMIDTLLQDGTPMTRPEIVEALSRRRIKLNNIQATNVMIFAELEMIACNGPRKNKEFTYTLFDSKVPPREALTREDALRRLTRCYFGGHGPATAKDYMWWSGLSNADVKLGLSLCGESLSRVTVDNREYFYDPASCGDVTGKPPGIQLIPPYDEFTVGYGNRDLVGGADKELQEYLGNLIFKPLVIDNGKAIGIWRREVKKHLAVDIGLMGHLSKARERQLVNAAKAYQKFLGLTTSDVRIVQGEC